MHRKAFIYKLRPTKEQEGVFSETLETCRHLYNDALRERKEAWEERQESVGFARRVPTKWVDAALPAKKIDNAFLPRLHSQVAQDVLHRVDRSFQAFFRRCKAGEAPGYPRFKGRGWYDSFTFPQWGNGVKFVDGRLFLSKIGAVRICSDRPLHGTPKTCTIHRRADGRVPTQWVTRVSSASMNRAPGRQQGRAWGSTSVSKPLRRSTPASAFPIRVR
jgi:putative transposase